MNFSMCKRAIVAAMAAPVIGMILVSAAQAANPDKPGEGYRSRLSSRPSPKSVFAAK